jgi:hypothetical protein
MSKIVHVHERDLLAEAMDWMGSLALVHIAQALHKPSLDHILSKIDTSKAGMPEGEVGQRLIKHVVRVHDVVFPQINGLDHRTAVEGKDRRDEKIQ